MGEGTEDSIRDIFVDNGHARTSEKLIEGCQAGNDGGKNNNIDKFFKIIRIFYQDKSQKIHRKNTQNSQPFNRAESGVERKKDRSERYKDK